MKKASAKQIAARKAWSPFSPPKRARIAYGKGTSTIPAETRSFWVGLSREELNEKVKERFVAQPIAVPCPTDRISAKSVQGDR